MRVLRRTSANCTVVFPHAKRMSSYHAVQIQPPGSGAAIPPSYAVSSTPLLMSHAEPVSQQIKPPTKPAPQTCCGAFLTWFLTLLMGCLPLCTSFFTVLPNEEVLVIFWGRLNAVYREAGLHWYNSIGRSLVRVSTRTQAFEVPKTVVVGTYQGADWIGSRP